MCFRDNISKIQFLQRHTKSQLEKLLELLGWTQPSERSVLLTQLLQANAYGFSQWTICGTSSLRNDHKLRCRYFAEQLAYQMNEYLGIQTEEFVERPNEVGNAAQDYLSFRIPQVAVYSIIAAQNEDTPQTTMARENYASQFAVFIRGKRIDAARALLKAIPKACNFSSAEAARLTSQLEVLLEITHHLQCTMMAYKNGTLR